MKRVMYIFIISAVAFFASTATAVSTATADTSIKIGWISFHGKIVPVTYYKSYLFDESDLGNIYNPQPENIMESYTYYPLNPIYDYSLFIDITGFPPSTPCVPTAGDVNGDGKVGIADAIYALQVSAGLR